MRFSELLEGRAPQFLNPRYEDLNEPLLLPDMPKARDRVIGAMRSGENIFVFSDYDADGIPGAVVLADFFRRSNYEQVSFYIPHRHTEGFGLSEEAVEEANRRGAKLIITVDCGTADIEAVAHAGKLGIDVIITDHHESNELPEAYAVVNPKRRDLPAGRQAQEYPFKELCGAALAYKLVQAVVAEERFGAKEGMEKWSLDMVAIATLSDMVPLIDENRVLAKFGLEVLRKSPRPGLEALCRRLGMDRRHISEDDVTFMLTPRINAASRMGVPEDAFKLLSTDNQDEAERLAAHLEEINGERKTLVATIVKDAKKHLKARSELSPVIVIGNPEWKPAILGLVASSLVEEYERPAFVWGRDGDGVLKGSCRSWNGYDLFELMNSVAGNFLEFGGHAGAGGFSVSLEQLSTLEAELSSALKHLSAVESAEARAIEIATEDVCEDLYKVLSVLAPFGVGNPKPIFRIKDAEVESVRQFGKSKDHLELILGKNTKAISFFSTPQSYGIVPKIGLRIRLDGHVEKSYFRGIPSLRLRIVDIAA